MNKIRRNSMFKKIFPFLFTLLFTCYGFSNEEYSIHPHVGWTSARFEIKMNDNWVGEVEKSSLGVRTHYDLIGNWGSYGSCKSRLLSWGSSSKEFDVYDNGRYGLLRTIRCITGGEYPGRFEFYNWTGNVYATADVDLENGVVDVVQGGNPHLRFRAHADDAGELYWTYEKVNRWFNIQTMHAFAAILADYFPPTNAFTPEEVSLDK